MPTNMEFNQFVTSWLQKANGTELTDLNSYFDRFFTLYVVYNRLYAEATFILAKQGQLDLYKCKSFPDTKAATQYLCQYIGSNTLIEAFEADPKVTQALRRIEELINDNAISIMLHMVTGESQRVKDEALLTRLRANSNNTRATAILETIYAVRCNMFHGHKEFHYVQVEILAPVIIVMEKIISLLKKNVIRE